MGQLLDGRDCKAPADRQQLSHHLSLALMICVLLCLLPMSTHVQAEEVAAPEITNPAIRHIIQSRAARVKELNRHKASGALGENNRAGRCASGRAGTTTSPIGR